MSIACSTRALLVIALSIFSAASIQGAPGRRPLYVSYTLAGVKLKDASNDGVQQDRRTGYYLRSSRECDGGHVSLALKPSRTDAADGSVFPADARAGRLPSLATGHGVAIGDSARSVRRRLGMPTRVHWTRRKPGERVYSFIYVYRYRDGERVTEYQADYTFRNGSLSAIELQEDVIEGG